MQRLNLCGDTTGPTTHARSLTCVLHPLAPSCTRLYPSHCLVAVLMKLATQNVSVRTDDSDDESDEHGGSEDDDEDDDWCGGVG